MRPAPASESASDETAPARLDLLEIRAARQRLGDAIVRTPVREALVAGREVGCRLWIKHDHLQATGSFKERGAAHALSLIDDTTRGRGVIAASAGNHALGLARHGARLGVRVTLVMPRGAAHVKVERCRAWGAEVVLHGDTFDDAERFARTKSVRECRAYVHPFDDLAVIAGQGTLGLELIEQVPDLDLVVLPVGGGGLLAGAAVAVKSLRPRARIVAVEPAAVASYATAWREGSVNRAVAVGRTLADGLAVARVGAAGFALSRGLVDEVVQVSEDEIATAMLHLFEHERVVAEGAGAVALAAVLAGKVGDLGGKVVALPVCGANVDPHTFAQALQRGLALQSTAKTGDPAT